MKKISAVLLVLFLVSCSGKTGTISDKNSRAFQSREFGFSFSYPAGFNAIEKDLPNNWAATDSNKNTIIFIVSSAGNSSLYDLGLSHAIKDVYEDSSHEIDLAKVNEIAKILSIQNFNGREWFTYGLKSGSVNSLVSGTICKGKEVLIAFVMMDPNNLDSGKLVYHDLLDSFSCA